MFIKEPLFLAYGIVGLVLILVMNAAYQAYNSPLKSIPGPWYTNFTHYVLKYYNLVGKRMHYVHGLHQSYGHVVRISPTQVAIADPNTFSAIHKIGSGYVKSSWYEDYMNGVDKNSGIGIGLFAFRDVKKHAARRKLFARAFSVSSLRQNCEVVVREKVEKAVTNIVAEASSGKSNILKWWMLMTSDVIGQLSFGKSFDLLETGKKSHYIEVLETAALSGTIQYELPWIYHICKYIPLQSVQLFVNAGGLVNAYGGQAVLNLRNHSDNKANLFANILSETENSDSKTELTDQDIRNEAGSFMLAGSDTTSNTLTYAIWSVLKRPDLHKRLLVELDTVGDVFDDAALEKLPLLNAVLQETLRLYGGVPGNLGRVVPAGGMTVGGHYIPGGFEVETQAWTLHRDPAVFEDPLRFDESRWLDPAAITPQQKTSFCAFGAGTRICLGIHLARMELRLGAALLLKQCPKLKLSEEMNDSMMEMFNFFLAGPVGQRCDVTLL